MRAHEEKDVEDGVVRKEAKDLVNIIVEQLEKDLEYAKNSLEKEILSVLRHGYRLEEDKHIIDKKYRVRNLLYGNIYYRLYGMNDEGNQNTMINYAMNNVFVGEKETFKGLEKIGNITGGNDKGLYRFERTNNYKKEQLLASVENVTSEFSGYVDISEAASVLNRDERYVRKNLKLYGSTGDLVKKEELHREKEYLDKKETYRKDRDYLSAVEIGGELGVSVDFVYSKFNDYFEVMAGKEIRYIHRSKLVELAKKREEIFREYDKYNPLDYLIVKEVSLLLDKTDVSISKWVKEGRLGSVPKINNGYRIHWDYVREKLDEYGYDGKEILDNRRYEVEAEIKEFEKYILSEDKKGQDRVMKKARSKGRSKILMEVKDRIVHGNGLPFITYS